jgi:hypothetical protein
VADAVAFHVNAEPGDTFVAPFTGAVRTTEPGAVSMTNVSGTVLFPLVEVAVRLKLYDPGSWFCVPEIVRLEVPPGITGFVLNEAVKPAGRPVVAKVIGCV